MSGDSSGERSEPFDIDGEVVEAVERTVRIRPELRIWPIRGGGFETEGTNLMFVVESGKDSADMWEAEGWWLGERGGPEWEEMKAFWLEQFAYINRYLGEATLRIGLQLCFEAQAIAVRYAQVEHAFEQSLDLNRFDQATGQIESEQQALQRACWEMGDFQFLVGWQAFGARARMREAALLQVGSNRMLRFSPAMLKAYMSALPDLEEKWRESKRLIRDNRGQWRDAVRNYWATSGQAYGELPEDLLEAAGRAHNRPNQIARVHAARFAGITTYAEPQAKLTMAQEKTIHREIDKYLSGDR